TSKLLLSIAGFFTATSGACARRSAYALVVCRRLPDRILFARSSPEHKPPRFKLLSPNLFFLRLGMCSATRLCRRRDLSSRRRNVLVSPEKLAGNQLQRLLSSVVYERKSDVKKDLNFFEYNNRVAQLRDNRSSKSKHLIMEFNSVEDS
ncbi:hypothetical protein IGI04_034879, partial [Brassica rapa subsp. trilocularis]